MTPYTRSAAALPTDYRRVLEASNLPIEVATSIADALDENARLREALDSARVAIWDAHYGKGIAVEYARSVTNLIDAALKGKP